MTNQLIDVTDAQGRPCLYTSYVGEPLPGSVVLSEGEHGTAWQRFFSDGLWHRVGGGRGLTWASLLRKRNLVLVYEAAPREDRSVS